MVDLTLISRFYRLFVGFDLIVLISICMIPLCCNQYDVLCVATEDKLTDYLDANPGKKFPLTIADLKAVTQDDAYFFNIHDQ